MVGVQLLVLRINGKFPYVHIFTLIIPKLIPHCAGIALLPYRIQLLVALATHFIGQRDFDFCFRLFNCRIHLSTILTRCAMKHVQKPFSTAVCKCPWRVLFFGSDEFSLPHLELLFDHYLSQYVFVWFLSAI